MSLKPPVKRTLLNQVTVTGAGNSVDLMHTYKDYSWQIELTGSPTSIEVRLEGSIDGTNWGILDLITDPSAAGLRHVVNKPIQYIRANVVTLSGGTNPTVTVKFLA